MKTKKLKLTVLVLTLTITTVIMAQLPLTIDLQTEYQKLEGCGGSSAYDEWVKNTTAPPSHFWTDGWGATAFDFLGCSLMEVTLPFDLQTSNLVYNRNSPQMKQQIYVLRKMKGKGVNKFYLAVNTPPAWMKTSNALMGGVLQSSNYNLLADYIIEYMKAIKDSCGIEFYAFCPQNWPFANITSYFSCYYSTSEYNKLIKTTFSRIYAAGFHPLGLALDPGFAPYSQGKTYVDAVLADTSVSKYVHVIGTGGEANYDEANDRLMSERARAAGLQAWRTTIIGYSGSWANALNYGRVINTYLASFSFNAFLWAELNTGDETDGHEDMMAGSNISYRTAVAAHYWKYSRHGSVRIGVSGTGSLFYAVKSDEENYVAVTIQNSSTSSYNYTIQGNNLPEKFNLYRSQVNSYMQLVGTYSQGQSFKVDTASIYTLVSKSDNNKPRLDAISNKSIMVNSLVKDTLTLTGIDDGEISKVQPLSFKITSSDTTIIPTPKLIYTPNSNNGKIVISPIAGKSGIVTISVSVTDSTISNFSTTTTRSFTYKIIPFVNAAPVIDPISDQTIQFSSTKKTIQLTGIGDGNDGSQKITAKIKSDNLSITRSLRINYTTGNTGTITFNPDGGEGSANITITLYDDAGCDMGGVDSLQVKFTITISKNMSLLTNVIEELKISPNPASDIVYIDIDESIISLRILDMSGKIVKETNSLPEEKTINIERLTSGCYIVEVTTKNNRFTKLLIVK